MLPSRRITPWLKEIRRVGKENPTGKQNDPRFDRSTDIARGYVLQNGAGGDSLPRLLLQCAGLATMTSTTKLTLVTGDSYRVEGDVKDVERIILDAARGSIMQLAWLVEAETGNDLAINPDHVMLLRTLDS